MITVIFYRKKDFFDRTIFKRWANRPVRIDLDEIGSFCWKLIDGKRNVGEITKLAEEEFQEKIAPAEERVQLFFKQLHKSGLVTLYGKKEENDS